MAGYIKNHNRNAEAHSDIRQLISNLSSRKIAGLDLTDDISAYELITAIYSNSQAGMYLSNVISQNSAVRPNTEARHTHGNKEILEKLSEDSNGDLLFDGNKLGSGDGAVPVYDEESDYVVFLNTENIEEAIQIAFNDAMKGAY